MEEFIKNRICIDEVDITTLDVACIVNAANQSLLGGGGVDGAIHRAAGPELLKECRTLNGCKTGQAKLTRGYALKASYVIHTVGPIYSGSASDAKLLRDCYWNSLELARTKEIHSIAFPAISTGAYRYPLEDATRIALTAVTDWLKTNPDYEMTVIFACYSHQARATYDRIWREMQ